MLQRAEPPSRLEVNLIRSAKTRKLQTLPSTLKYTMKRANEFFAPPIPGHLEVSPVIFEQPGGATRRIQSRHGFFFAYLEPAIVIHPEIDAASFTYGRGSLLIGAKTDVCVMERGSDEIYG